LHALSFYFDALSFHGRLVVFVIVVTGAVAFLEAVDVAGVEPAALRCDRITLAEDWLKIPGTGDRFANAVPTAKRPKST